MTGIRRAHVPSATLTAGEWLTALVRPLPLAEAEQIIQERTGSGGAVLFASARGALAAAVEVLGGGRVAVPAYTCIAVPNAVLSGGGIPVYSDVSSGGVSSGEVPEDVSICIAQDTFGLRAPLSGTTGVIRDSSHRPAWPATAECPLIVTSFEHSKWMSAGQGGLVLTSDPELAARLRTLRDRHPGPATGRVRHSLVTGVVAVMGRLEWNGRIDRANRLARIARILDRNRVAGQSRHELAAYGVDPGLRGAPNTTVARLACTQLAKATWIETRRRRVVEIYDDRAGVDRAPEPLVRYPMTVIDPERWEAAVATTGWDVAGRWFAAPLHPAEADAELFGFDPGAAPVAARLAAETVNLPTHPLVDDRVAAALIDAALGAGATPLVRETLSPAPA